MKKTTQVLSMLGAGVLLLAGACSPPAPREEAPAPAPAPAPTPTVSALSAIEVVNEGDVDRLRQVLLTSTDIVKSQFVGQTTLLHYAAARPHPKVVELLLLSGAEVDAKDQVGTTPLMIALREHQRENVALLIERGANANGAMRNGRTCLHAAIVANYDVAMLEKMIARGADIKAQDAIGQSALHIAVEAGRGDVVEMLLAKGADIELKDREGLTPADLARRNANPAVFDVIAAHKRTLAAAKATALAANVETTTAKIVPPTPVPVAPARPDPPKPVPSTPTTIANQISMTVNDSKNAVTSIQARNTGMGTVKATFIIKYLFDDDYISQQQFTCSLDPFESRELKAAFFRSGTSRTTTGTSRTTTGTTTPRYDPYTGRPITGTGTGTTRPDTTLDEEAVASHGSVLGYVVDVMIDGKINTTKYSSSQILTKLRRLEKENASNK